MTFEFDCDLDIAPWLSREIELTIVNILGLEFWTEECFGPGKGDLFVLYYHFQSIKKIPSNTLIDSSAFKISNKTCSKCILINVFVCYSCLQNNRYIRTAV